jgi:polyisoprenoid-binding protein YceI
MKIAKWFLPAICSLAFSGSMQAQKFFTRDAAFQFTASTPLEKIDATSKGGTLVVDAASGALEAAVLVKGFIFEKALMQEHFNENYIESDKYPRAQFKGKLVNAQAVQWGRDGTYPVTVKGVLSIHGVDRERDIPAEITIKGGKISARSEFDVVVADHDIKIPSLVADKIARVAKVSIQANLSELKK